MGEKRERKREKENKKKGKRKVKKGEKHDYITVSKVWGRKFK